MKFDEVKFLELPLSSKANALQQMAEIHRQDPIHDDVETADDFANMIIEDNYNPDKNFSLMSGLPLQG